MRRLSLAMIAIGLALVTGAFCAHAALERSAGWAVVFGVSSGFQLAIAAGYVAFYFVERRLDRSRS